MPTIRKAAIALAAVAIVAVAIACSFSLRVSFEARTRRALAQATILWTTLPSGPTTIVTVAPGEHVLLDCTVCEVLDLVVRGTLEVPDGADARLIVRRNLIIDGGRTIRGPTLRRFVVDWPSVNDATFTDGGHHSQALTTDPGLWFFRGASWGIQGDPKLAWTRLRTPLSAGATVIDLPVDPVGWLVGDELLFTPTEAPTVPNFMLRHDVRAIAAIDGRRVTLAAPLLYPHPTTTLRDTPFGAEVVNLTRNVQFLGRPTGHPHLYAHALTNPLTLAYIEIRHFGPRRSSPDVGYLGRYALHFHMNGDATRGSMILGVIIRESTNMAFVAHASHGVTFQDVVAFDVKVSMLRGSEFAFGWDASPPGVEVNPNASHDITYLRAGVHLVRRVPGINPMFGRQAGFSTSEGLRNRILDSWASGVAVGGGGSQLAGLLWAEASTARRQGAYEIVGFVGHDNQSCMVAWTNDHPLGAGLPHRTIDAACFNNSLYALDWGAYANSYLFGNLRAAGNGLAAVKVHSQGLAGAPATSFEDGWLDGNGRECGAVQTTGHQMASAPVYWTRNALRNYTRAGFCFITPGSAREWAILDSNTFSGNPYWLGSGIPATSRITVNDSIEGRLELYRRDQFAPDRVLRSEWNAQVRQLAAPSR